MRTRTRIGGKIERLEKPVCGWSDRSRMGGLSGSSPLLLGRNGWG